MLYTDPPQGPLIDTPQEHFPRLETFICALIAFALKTTPPEQPPPLTYCLVANWPVTSKGPIYKDFTGLGLLVLICQTQGLAFHSQCLCLAIVSPTCKAAHSQFIRLPSPSIVIMSHN